MHFRGHVDSWCKQNCNPNDHNELKPINTVICEQINYWLGKYKFPMKCMNQVRYNFFLYIIFSNYNQINLNNNKNLCFRLSINQAHKRHADAYEAE